jgi:hypothetical protein
MSLLRAKKRARLLKSRRMMAPNKGDASAKRAAEEVQPLEWEKEREVFDLFGPGIDGWSGTFL